MCDVYDAEALRAAVVAFAPDAVMHQLTDLPDDVALVRGRRRQQPHAQRGDAQPAGGRPRPRAERISAQSIAWELPPERRATIDAHERAVLDAGGVVIRYGQLYGPGTYFEDEPPGPPRIHVDDAARQTVPLLDAPAGIVELVDLVEA